MLNVKRQDFSCISEVISQFKTNSIWAMEIYTNEQRVNVTQAYYEKGHSHQNAFRLTRRSCDIKPLVFFLSVFFEEKQLRRETIQHINGIETQLCFGHIKT